jgi:hypothetical protein
MDLKQSKANGWVIDGRKLFDTRFAPLRAELRKAGARWYGAESLWVFPSAELWKKYSLDLFGELVALDIEAKEQIVQAEAAKSAGAAQQVLSAPLPITPKKKELELPGLPLLPAFNTLAGATAKAVTAQPMPVQSMPVQPMPVQPMPVQPMPVQSAQVKPLHKSGGLFKFPAPLPPPPKLSSAATLRAAHHVQPVTASAAATTEPTIDVQSAPCVPAAGGKKLLEYPPCILVSQQVSLLGKRIPAYADEFLVGRRLATKLRVCVRRHGVLLHSGDVLVVAKELESLVAILSEVRKRAIEFNKKALHYFIETSMYFSPTPIDAEAVARKVAYEIQTVLDELKLAVLNEGPTQIKTAAILTVEHVANLYCDSANQKALAAAIKEARAIAADRKREKATAILTETPAIDAAIQIFSVFAIPLELEVVQAVRNVRAV